MDRKIIYGSAAAVCLLAVFPLPYGFYTFLRLLVSIAGTVAAVNLQKEGNFLWVLFAAIVLLFNPLIPVYLSRELWFPIDLFVAGCFGWLLMRS